MLSYYLLEALTPELAAPLLAQGNVSVCDCVVMCVLLCLGSCVLMFFGGGWVVHVHRSTR